MRIQEIEEQSVLVVEFPSGFYCDTFKYEGTVYQRYVPDPVELMYLNHLTGKYELIHPESSVDSLLEANRIYFTNPLPKPIRYEYQLMGKSHASYVEDSRLWKEAERNLWDKDNTYVYSPLIVDA